MNRQPAASVNQTQARSDGQRQGSSKGATAKPAALMAAALAAATKIEGMSSASPRVVRSRMVVNSNAISAKEEPAPKLAASGRTISATPRKPVSAAAQR
jgi:hypothetical protein